MQELLNKLEKDQNKAIDYLNICYQTGKITMEEYVVVIRYIISLKITLKIQNMINELYNKLYLSH